MCMNGFRPADAESPRRICTLKFALRGPGIFTRPRKQSPKREVATSLLLAAVLAVAGFFGRAPQLCAPLALRWIRVGLKKIQKGEGRRAGNDGGRRQARGTKTGRVWTRQEHSETLNGLAGSCLWLGRACYCCDFCGSHAYPVKGSTFERTRFDLLRRCFKATAYIAVTTSGFSSRQPSGDSDHAPHTRRYTTQPAYWLLSRRGWAGYNELTYGGT